MSDSQPTSLDSIFETLDKHIVNGIAISIARDEVFDTDKMLAQAKAAINRLLIQERLDELSRYSYPVDLTKKGLDVFWKRTDELKAELSSLTEGKE